jgi:chromosome segregation ATPase
MEIPKFIGDEDKDEINPMEWLRMVKEYGMTPSRERIYFFGEAWKWWMSIDNDTRLNITWEAFEKLFSNKWIKDTKMEEMHKIQDELIEAKEKVSKLQKDNEELRKYIIKKNNEFAKMQSLNESLIKEVKNLKQEKSSKGKWENDDSREELKKKDEEIKRLCKHNQELLNDVKKVKRTFTRV